MVIKASRKRLAMKTGSLPERRTLATANSKVTSVEHEGHLSRPQALVNLDRCLAHLAAHGVDVIGIQASDLAQGDLKASLQLLGQLRRQYDGLRLSPGGRTKGDGDQAAALKEPTVTWRSPSPCRLDNSLVMPGRVATSPQLHRPVPVHMRDTSLPVQNRSVTALDASRVVPGMMSTEGPMYRPQPTFTDHSATLNKDRNVYGHIHRQDERSLHDNDTHLATGKTASGPRPSSNPTGASSGVPPERPPTTLGVAWAAGPTVKQVPECESTPCRHDTCTARHTDMESVERDMQDLGVHSAWDVVGHYV
ncbi:hypothetical protein C0Q70_13830 [Pomacea canaliculata]|uniref:Calponin-homology (CH) domain-containing protein n=1 Tax=Pomacea canaliculata TaxID=400727 RepID=A0A2T7NYC5_POMCA|nr:hypothetical protein C0Q70_13830 [Pomacea canaliculata]